MEEFTALIAWAAQALAAWSQANPILAEGVSFACRLLAPMLTLLILVRTIRSLLTVPAQPEVWAVLGLPNGVKVPLTRWENIMGRSPSADVVVNYPSVSRQHAAIIRRGDDADWTVYDLGSKMGTSVNGQPVEGSAPVTVGDTVELGGVPLRLIDTAGLRDSSDPIERLGVERSRQAMEEAELILVLWDSSVTATQEDGELLETALSLAPTILIHTKTDLPSAPVPFLNLSPLPPVVELSTKTGEGLADLEAAVAQLFPKGSDSAYGELLSNARQAQAARRALEGGERARQALEAGMTPDALLTDVEEALSALGELTGQSVREDVTARIFQRFCVGK